MEILWFQGFYLFLKNHIVVIFENNHNIDHITLFSVLLMILLTDLLVKLLGVRECLLLSGVHCLLICNRVTVDQT